MLVRHFPPTESTLWLTDELQTLARRAAYRAYDKLNSVHEPYLRDPDWNAAKVSLLTTSGTIGRHIDSHDLPPFSYHAILINDGFVAKGTQQRRRETQKQEPGTIIELNIHEEHHLAIDGRFGRYYVNADYPTWATLCFNTEAPLSWEEIQAHYHAFVSRMSLQK